MKITAEQLNEYLSVKTIEGYLVRCIECADGTLLSVQTSRCHYCSPRDDKGPWCKVEVMVQVGSAPKSWREWEDGDGSKLYGYIPIERVVALINRRGGTTLEPAP